jgi:nitrous oxide reductase
MKAETKKQRVARRDLLKVAGLGGVAGAAALASKAGKAEAATGEEVKGSGYRETEHVRTYYDLAKF